jgi:hypothetical protein
MEIPDDLLNEQIEVCHQFEVDLNTVVVKNFELTIAGITDYEQKSTEQIREECAGDSPELLGSLVGTQEWFCEDLRSAATHLALVGLVTRFQHWIEVMAKRHEIGASDRKSRECSGLIHKLKALNEKLGEGPVSLDFFSQLETARDSVIHSDSRARWDYGRKQREVAPCYCSGSNLSVSGDQLKEAVASAVRQVKWYDEQATSLKRPA